MMPTWLQTINDYQKTSGTYSQHDYELHFADSEARDGLRDYLRKYSHKTMRFFNDSSDFGGLVDPAYATVIAEYGAVETPLDTIATQVSETREKVTRRWLYKTEPVETYREGEKFKQTFIEGGANTIRWQKPGALIAESYEAVSDLPLDIMQANLRLTLQEFTVRSNKTMSHELHNGTSDKFDNQATDKDGVALDKGWREIFDNVYSAAYDPQYNPDATRLVSWNDIRNARAKILRRPRDAHRPTVCVLNATSEANLADSMAVNNAAFLGGADTFFKTGSLPNIYGLQFIVIPDAHFGYFGSHTIKRNDDFQTTNDAYLIEPSSFMFRHNREPITTEKFRLFSEQKHAQTI